MKNLLPIFVLLFLFTATLVADPQYYNYNNGTSYNMFPLNVVGGKRIQLYIAPGEFTTPSPAPSGNILKFSVRISTGYPLGPVTYTNFRIIFIDSSISGNSMDPGWYLHPTEDTVFYRASLGPITAAADTWLDFTLDHPHNYNNTKGLIIAIEQQAASGSYSGYSLQHTTTATYRRHYSVGGSPFVYSNRSLYVPNCGIDIAPAVLWYVPELIYYKFENNPTPTSTPNYASSPVGINPATITGHTLTTGGQFDTCLSGTGGSGATSFLNTGWNCNLGSSNWTIGFWVNNLIDLNPTYLWGDPGSTTFRCFYGGAALPNNMLLRGPLSDILISCPMPGSWYFHFVYNGTNVLIYRNGTLLSTNPRTINMPTGSGFKVGAYSTTSYSMSGKMDEYRIYNRALTAAEITATWNSELPILVGVSSNNNQVPGLYSLSQNYPNPFNPTTVISYTLPKAGNVKLVVSDVLGREVTTLVNEFKTAGTYSIEFNASNHASGVYFYKIVAGDFTDTKKMILIK